MSRIRCFFTVKLLPAALSAALVIMGSSTIASAQGYDQNPSGDQNAVQAQNVQADPPSRVARLAYLSGNVEFAPAGENDWGTADVNRPLITGDRLMTGRDGRAALELGDAALRINHDSAFNFLDLDNSTAQVELSQGTLNLRVRRLADGANYEIDTPTAAFVAGEPGNYRVDVAPDGKGAMVTVFEGSGTVYGENGASRPVQAGQSYRFEDMALTNVQVQRVPAPDDFDRFSNARDTRYTNSASARYVSPDVVGYDDLDEYGDWQDTSNYGAVWYPTRVAANWAPYRDGHWTWIEPWGWTWVDNQAWGYAPSHYGRWVYVSNRWGWMPGPRSFRPVYSPALVAFVGGSGFSVSVNVGGGYGQPIGWFPLGPRDIYVPPYRSSRNYFNQINVTNIRNVYVNQTVINNYYNGYASGHPYRGRDQYAYRHDQRAFTAVPRNVFVGAGSVRPAVLHIKPSEFAKGNVMPRPHVAPTRASLAIRQPRNPIRAPVAKAFDRTVVARTAPPPRPTPFAAREKVIAKQGGAPIPVTELRQMRQQQAKSQPRPQRVRVVTRDKQPVAGARVPAQNVPAAGARQPGSRPGGRVIGPPAMDAIRPIPARTPSNEPSLRRGELPSARFAHPRGNSDKAPSQTNVPPTQQDRQRAEQARQKADQARGNGPAQEVQQRSGVTGPKSGAQPARQAQQEAAGNRQRAEQERAQKTQQQATQQRQKAEQQRAEQVQQRANQTRLQDQQRQQGNADRAQKTQQQATQQRQKAEQQRAEQTQQRANQTRVQDQQRQQQNAERAQQQATQQRQQADQQRANQTRLQDQQRQQQNAQRSEQQAAQQRQQAEQQRAEQAQQRAVIQQQRSAERVQKQTQQRATPAQQKPAERKAKQKDQDQDDNGH